MRKVQLRKYYEEIRVGQHKCPRCRNQRVYFLGEEKVGLYKMVTKEKLHCAKRVCNYQWEELLGASATHKGAA